MINFIKYNCFIWLGGKRKKSLRLYYNSFVLNENKPRFLFSTKKNVKITTHYSFTLNRQKVVYLKSFCRKFIKSVWLI